MHSEWGHYWPANGCENKTASASLCSFELYCVQRTKPPHCDVKEQWCQYIVMAQPGGQTSDVAPRACDDGLNSTCVAVVTFTSQDGKGQSCLERALFMLCNRRAEMFYQWVFWAALCSAVGVAERQHQGGGGRQAGLTYWWKKAASVVWPNVDSLEAQAEGGMTTKLISILNNTSHPSVNWCSFQLSTSIPSLRSASQSPLESSFVPSVLTAVQRSTRPPSSLNCLAVAGGGHLHGSTNCTWTAFSSLSAHTMFFIYDSSISMACTGIHNTSCEVSIWYVCTCQCEYFYIFIATEGNDWFIYSYTNVL